MPGSEGAPDSIRVLHLIPHLGQGGAEAALAALLAAPQPSIEHAVCTMIAAKQHFDVTQLVMKGAGSRTSYSPAIALHLRRALRQVRPHVLHCWMYHANFLSLASIGFGARILWSIHAERPDASKRLTRGISAACAHLSHILPDSIVYVAETARVKHEAAGYAAGRSIVIPNGINTERFRPHTLPDTCNSNIRLGMVARYDPSVKGHHFLIDVLAKHPLRNRLNIVFAGAECDIAPELLNHLESAGLLGQARLYGALTEIEHLYAELDMLVIPSYSEALPMSLLEGAAAGLVICASRVGDIPRLGLPEETLFEPGDALGCAYALEAAATLIRRPDTALRQRALVDPRFSIQTIARRYAELYRDVVEAQH